MMSPQIPPAESTPRCVNANFAWRQEIIVMWGNTVLPVKRATACATNVMQEIASMSTLKKKELLGRANTMGAYLKCN
jgi:hypothetical protein